MTGSAEDSKGGAEMSRGTIRKRLLRRPSPAMVVAMLALGAALAGVANGGIGGTRAPLAAAPFITGAHVLDGSLTGADINQATLTGVANAAHANAADSATNAGHATSADSASSATNATNATNAGNANTVGGYAANSLVRAARTSGSTSVSSTSFDSATAATVSITAPTAGFVLVTAATADQAIGSSGCPCWVGSKIWDNVSSQSSPWIEYDTVDSSGDYAGSGSTWVFPVTAGARSFSLKMTKFNGTPTVTVYAEMTAVFIPFGSTGSPTILSNPRSPTRPPIPKAYGQ